MTENWCQVSRMSLNTVSDKGCETSTPKMRAPTIGDAGRTVRPCVVWYSRFRSVAATFIALSSARLRLLSQQKCRERLCYAAAPCQEAVGWHAAHLRMGEKLGSARD